MQTQKRHAIKENTISSWEVNSGHRLFRLLNHPMPLHCLLENMEKPGGEDLQSSTRPNRASKTCFVEILTPSEPR